MKLSDTRFRAMAFALSAIITTALVTTLTATMSPQAASTYAARSGVHGAARTEVAIVPARIEVVGRRSVDTAASVVRAARPRT